MQSSAREPFNVQNNLVFGLNIQNAQLASLTRRVLVLAIISALKVFVEAVIRLSSSFQNSTALTTVIGAMIGLLVPCAGYYGAKLNNENLTCCFCCCNFLGGCCNVLSMCASWGFYKFAGFIVDHCNPSHPDPDLCTFDPSVWQNSFCQGKKWTPQQCFDYIEDTWYPGLKHAMIFATALSIPSILLQCLSFCWGKRLYDAIKAGDVIHAPPSQFAARPVMVQPVGQ